MSGTITLQSYPGLSEILGAYDTAHWNTVVAQLKPAVGVLKRGSVLSAVAGKMELTTGANQATAYGILLDASVDTAAPYTGGTVTGSVARSGSFRGAALIVGAGTDEAALAIALRDIGIFVEGAVAPVALAAKGSEEEPEPLEASAESMARRRREEDEARRHHKH